MTTFFLFLCHAFFFPPIPLLQRIVNCSLKLTINNDLVVFLIFRAIMVKGRRLKKVGGDLEA